MAEVEVVIAFAGLVNVSVVMMASGAFKNSAGWHGPPTRR
jgi:hypothetical protein